MKERRDIRFRTRDEPRAQTLEDDTDSNPFKFGPATFVIHTQPGLQEIGAEEFVARVPAAAPIAVREVAGRNGLSLIQSGKPAPLNSLRIAEDLFALVGYARPLRSDRSGLEQARAAARRAPYIEAALANRVSLAPGRRAGNRLDFRVVARTGGRTEFRRVDLQHAVERGMLERGDRQWRLREDSAGVELWATLLGDELLLTLRLSDERMRQREYKSAHLPGSLRPSVAAAMAWMSQPTDEDVVLDPMCGAGTILIERAHAGRYAKLLGGDNSVAALDAARTNIGPRYKPIELRQWDAHALPLPAAAVNRLITNLPWGRKVGSAAINRQLYPKLLKEFRRVVREGGLMVLLSGETRLMRELLPKFALRPSRVLNITVLGAHAAIYVCPVNRAP